MKTTTTHRLTLTARISRIVFFRNYRLFQEELAHTIRRVGYLYKRKRLFARILINNPNDLKAKIVYDKTQKEFLFHYNKMEDLIFFLKRPFGHIVEVEFD